MKMMPSYRCPNCGDEMEEVVGFPGYVWCRDCHITKQVEEDSEHGNDCASTKETADPIS